MECQNCGQSNPDSAKYCGNCRTFIQNPNEAVLLESSLPQENEITNGFRAKIAHISLFIWGSFLIMGGLMTISEDDSVLGGILILISAVITLLAGYQRLKNPLSALWNPLRLTSKNATTMLFVIGIVMLVIGTTILPPAEITPTE